MKQGPGFDSVEDQLQAIQFGKHAASKTHESWWNWLTAGKVASPKRTSLKRKSPKRKSLKRKAAGSPKRKAAGSPKRKA